MKTYSEKIATYGLFVGVVSIIVSLAIPEIRIFIGLEKQKTETFSDRIATSELSEKKANTNESNNTNYEVNHSLEIERDVIAWKIALRINEISAYKEYLIEFPNGNFTQDAKNNINQLMKIKQNSNINSEISKVEPNENDLNTKDILIGTWEGVMYQPGYNSFPVRIVLRENSKNKKLFGQIEHSTLSCRGNLEFIRQSGSDYIFFQDITIGETHCLNGENRLIVENRNTITRIWYRPGSGEEGARGTLRKIN